VSLTYTDIFCGAGGSSIGLSAAGLQLVTAANHWQRAIETHAANFPDAEHLCADINHYDMRRLPRTDMLWASPICTENSPAGGRRRTRGQLALMEFGPIASAGFERTRATFHDVIRATEVHRYAAVVVENVVEAADWELFDWWVAGMCSLRPGYQVQYVSASSAHVGGAGNDPAPQWRDRLYLVFTRAGIPLPDVDPRPAALCTGCGTDVAAVQSWKRPGARRIGKYRQQYLYRCPNNACRHQQVEPYVLPAAAAIDWTDLGQRIGDRARPLAPATLRRIRLGLDRYAYPYTVPAGGTWRTEPADLAEPMPTRTATETDAMVVPPFMVERRDYNGPDRSRVRSVQEPVGTVVATARAVHTLVVPPLLVNSNHDDDRPRRADREPMATATLKIGDGLATAPPFIAMLRANNRATGVDEPIAALTTGRNHALVVPYYRTGTAKPANRPLDTLTTHDRFGLAAPAGVEVEDCRFRMLQPREHLRAQRFPDTYVVTGNKGEQTMQAGNAVSANVAQWLGGQIATALGGAA
jgi:DNA (cytosine-5)-methyltransferase 1